MTTYLSGRDGRVGQLDGRRVEFTPRRPATRAARPAVPGGEMAINADLVLIAIGFTGPQEERRPSPDPSSGGGPRGAFPRSRSSRYGDGSEKDVYAAGDCVRGADLVVTAIAEPQGRRGGRRALRRSTAGRAASGTRPSVQEDGELLDWKRRIFGRFKPAGRGSGRRRTAGGAGLRGGDEREHLFRSHPQSPIPAGRRAGLTSLPLYPYKTGTRRLARPMEPADGSVQRWPRAGPRRSRSRASAPGGSTCSVRSGASTCSGSRRTAAASPPVRQQRAAARRTAPAATFSTRSRAPTSASTATAWSLTSTSPTTRRARTTRAGSVRSRRPGTASTAGWRRGRRRPD